MLPAGVEACSQNHFSTASTLYSAPTVLVAARARIGSPGVVCNREIRLWLRMAPTAGERRSERRRAVGADLAKGK